MSYLSSCDPRAHFGFGADGSPVTVEILWPDGLRETWRKVSVDQSLVLTRGEGES